MSLSQIGCMQLYLKLGAMSFRLPAVTAAPISQPKQYSSHVKHFFMGTAHSIPASKVSQSFSEFVPCLGSNLWQCETPIGSHPKGPARDPPNPASHLHNNLNGVNQLLQQSDEGILLHKNRRHRFEICSAGYASHTITDVFESSK